MKLNKYQWQRFHDELIDRENAVFRKKVLKSGIVEAKNLIHAKNLVIEKLIIKNRVMDWRILDGELRHDRPPYVSISVADYTNSWSYIEIKGKGRLLYEREIEV